MSAIERSVKAIRGNGVGNRTMHKQAHSFPRGCG